MDDVVNVSSGALVGEAFGAPIEAGISHLLASSSQQWLAYGRGDADLDQVYLTNQLADCALCLPKIQFKQTVKLD